MVFPLMYVSGIRQNLSPSCKAATAVYSQVHACRTAHCPAQHTHLRCADDLPQMHIHPAVALHHVPIVGLPILQLHQLQRQERHTFCWASQHQPLMLYLESLKKFICVT